jgi:hypothetical protein
MTIVRSPGINRLAILFGDKAKQAKRIFKMTHNGLLDTPAGYARFKECYTHPSTEDLRMHVLNALAGGYGIEAFKTKKGDYVEYLNVGDPYTPTLIYFNGNYCIASWGDFAEKYGVGSICEV